MAHNRKYVPGLSYISVVRFRNEKIIILTQDEIEEIIMSSIFLDNAPFKWVSLSYLIGEKNVLVPKFDKISKKYEYLHISIKINSTFLKWADDHNLKLFKDILIVSALLALIHVGKKYNLSYNGIEDELKKYPPFPTTMEDCEAWPKG